MVEWMRVLTSPSTSVFLPYLLPRPYHKLGQLSPHYEVTVLRLVFGVHVMGLKDATLEGAFKATLQNAPHPSVVSRIGRGFILHLILLPKTCKTSGKETLLLNWCRVICFSGL